MITRGVVLILCLAGLPLLLGVTEINIGQNNTVITGGITGTGDCLKGNGKSKSETRNVGLFTDIVSDGSFDIHIRRGSRVEVRITADSNLLEVIQAKVNGKQLELRASKSFCTSNPVTINISLPEIKRLAAHGSSDIKLDCSDSSRSNLEIILNGSTSLTAIGKVDMLTAELGDSSDIDGVGLKAREVQIHASGSSEAQLWATDLIAGKSLDASDVVYHGSPAKVDVSAQDASDFEPAD